MKQFVKFTIDGEIFGADVFAVSEICRDTGITKVPNTSPVVEGVIQIRGKVIPTVDLRKQLGLSSSENSKRRILITKIQNRILGFVVGEIDGFVTVSSDAIKPASSEALKLDRKWIEARVDHPQGTFWVINFEAILALLEEHHRV